MTATNMCQISVVSGLVPPLNHVVNTVIKVVNFIHARGL